MASPRVYPHWAHDLRPAARDFQPNISEAFHWLLVMEGEEHLGICLAYSVLSPLIWQIDHAILPRAWRRTDEIGELLEHWLFTETPCQTAIGFTPAYNTLACRYAERRGMVLSGVIPGGYPKGGKLYDLKLYVKKRGII